MNDQRGQGNPINDRASDQSRREGVAWESPIPGALWLRNWRLGEWLHAPLSPLFEAFLLPVLADARQGAGSGRFGWRLPRSWRMREPSYTVINGYFYARVDPDPISVLFLPPRFLSVEIRGGWLTRWHAEGLPVYLSRLDRYRSADILSAPDGKLLQILQDLAGDTAEVWYALCLASGGAIPFQQFLRGVCGSALREELDGNTFVLLRGFQTKIVEEQEHLYTLAQEAASSTAILSWLEEHPLEELLTATTGEQALSTFRQHLVSHLESYGHQVPSLDFLYPSLAEDPGPLTVALRCYLSPGVSNPREVIAQTAGEREAITRKVAAALHPRRRAIFETILSRAQAYVVAREDLVFYLQMGWPIFRRILLEIGRRLSATAVVEQAEDIFFLTKEELFRCCSDRHSAGSLVADVSARCQLWKEHHALSAPTHLPATDDKVWRRAMRWPVNLRDLGIGLEQDKRVIVGTAASPGLVHGRARVLGFPSEYARLEPGDVLVTVATTPNWTPLFSKASAVVTDVGAVTSHASIVAREYRIPAVVGTQQATRTIRDGALVTVDGSAGRVYLE